MSAVFDKVCPFCGRLQLLWGGDTCDVCDRDSNGQNDRDEPVGSGTVIVPSVFESNQEGWEIISESKLRLGLTCNLDSLPTNTQLYVLRILQRKFL